MSYCGSYQEMRKSAGTEPLAVVVPIDPPAELLAPTFAGGGESGCWPLDLSESFNAGRSWASNWSNCFVVPCSCASMCRCTQSANQCPRAKGRVRLRPELDGLIRNAENVVSLS